MGHGSDWGEADWNTNRIDGIIIYGKSKACVLRRVPGSLTGARSSIKEAKKCPWILFVTKTEIINVRGCLEPVSYTHLELARCAGNDPRCTARG